MSAIGLPIDLVVEVDVNQSPSGTKSPNLRTMLLQGASNVIDVSERIREYSDIGPIAADFGTAAPEYLAAVEFFAQLPKPTSLFIGRWAKTATNGLLHGGLLSAAAQLASNFTGISAGAMTISVDGIPYYVGGMNFTGVGNMNAVAAIIQTALQATATGTPLCVWNAVYNRFDISSGTAGPGSSVSYASTPTAIGNYAFAANPIDGNSITINGTTVTFKNAVAAANQVAIGTSLAATLQNLMAFLAGSADTGLSALTYILHNSTLYLLSKVTGTVGDSITITSSGAFAVASGATLTGGSGVDVSALLGLTSATGARAPVPGIAAESVTDGVAALDNTGVYWYGLEIVSPTTSAEKLAVAGYIEASKHAYGITSSDPNCLDPLSTSDIAYLISNGKYNRTFVQYSNTPHAVASAFGRMLTVDPTQNASTITLFGKQEPGVQAETLTVTQANALKAKKCNVFVNYNTGKAIIQYGTMGSGLYFDSLYNADTFAATLQVNAFTAITEALTKIPQTDPGNNQIAGVLEQACDQFVTNGYLAPGTWTAGGVGSVKTGDFLPKGYYIFVPPVSSQSDADRAARKSVPFTILAKEAGAIHSANILVNVNR